MSRGRLSMLQVAALFGVLAVGSSSPAASLTASLIGEAERKRQEEDHRRRIEAIRRPAPMPLVLGSGHRHDPVPTQTRDELAAQAKRARRAAKRLGTHARKVGAT